MRKLQRSEVGAEQRLDEIMPSPTVFKLAFVVSPDFGLVDPMRSLEGVELHPSLRSWWVWFALNLGKAYCKLCPHERDSSSGWFERDLANHNWKSARKGSYTDTKAQKKLFSIEVTNRTSSSADLESGNAPGAFLQTPPPALIKFRTHGCMMVRFGILIGRAQLLSVPALEQISLRWKQSFMMTPLKASVKTRQALAETKMIEREFWPLSPVPVFWDWKVASPALTQLVREGGVSRAHWRTCVLLCWRGWSPALVARHIHLDKKLSSLVQSPKKPNMKTRQRASAVWKLRCQNHLLLCARCMGAVTCWCKAPAS